MKQNQIIYVGQLLAQHETKFVIFEYSQRWANII